MERTRVQFDMSAAAVQRLDDLAAETGAATRAEVVRRALALYDRLLKMEAEGTEISARRRDGKELLLPIGGF